jgi:putative glycosyltransferase
MKLSIVSTLYYSSQYVEEFCNRIVKSVPLEFNDFEIILVNDGSTDDSLEKALEVKNKIPQLIIIELSRNFGHHKAIMAGLGETSGDYVFLIDVDLEEKPEVLKTFWKKLNNSSLDVVYGVLKQRRGGVSDKLAVSAYYKIFNKIADYAKTEANLTTVRLMNKSYVEELVKHKSNDFFFAPTCSLVGFNQEGIFIEKSMTSPSTYNFYLKYHLLINSLFAFSTKPLYFIFYSGILISFF